MKCEVRYSYPLKQGWRTADSISADWGKINAGESGKGLMFIALLKDGGLTMPASFFLLFLLVAICLGALPEWLSMSVKDSALQNIDQKEVSLNMALC